MLHVALTGNAASGKSAVAGHFREWGATVLDADAIVRELQRPGTPVFDAIVTRFGPGIVAGDGTLDRSALRGLILRNPDARRALEAIVHPAVEAERQRLLLAARGPADSIVVSEIPLLFEAADPTGFDAVVLVDAPVDVRRRRLLQGRDLSPNEADRMLAAQLPTDTKRDRSDYVIDNIADLAALERGAQAVWQSLLVASGQPPG